MTVKFATYNIQYGVGQDCRYDLSRIVETLIDQDIICLQEVTTNWQICEKDNQPEKLASALNRYMAYAPGFEVDCSSQDNNGIITNSRRGFGNMILSSWPILYSRAHSLPRPTTTVGDDFYPFVDLPRVALEVVINVDGNFIRFISTHLSHLPGEQRSAQINALKKLVTTLPSEMHLWDDDPELSVYTESMQAPHIPQSTIIAGDFNFEDDSNDYAQMMKPLTDSTDTLIDAWLASKTRLSNPGTCLEYDGRFSRLDYLFATPDLNGCIGSAYSDQSNVSSDHFPLFFELDL
ncbi:MAG: endonuclease/exonuclease/phosphatase family protein [Gammaproteobacteria bacterium]|nr:endonuclease/exonuclease/phosphatase family protein [Gammaproteobacteria bacterium]